MTSSADTDDLVEVSDDGITIAKTFTSDTFPVPAICFEIDSSYDEPVTVRLAETIPESFPMDGIGFHPEYHSEQWTAFRDNRVEFTGTVEPDEPLVTVYGVRIDDDEAEQFLDEPEILDVRREGDEPADTEAETGERVDDALIDDIVDDDRNQVVKDMLAGDRDAVPGLDGETDAGDEEPSSDEDAGGLDLDISDVDPTPGDPGGEDEDDAPDIEVDFGEEEIPDPVTEPDDEPPIELDIDAAAAKVKERARDDDGGGSEAGETTEPGDEPIDGDGTDAKSSSSSALESVGAALAEEIRDGRIGDEDLAVITEALTDEPSGSDHAKLEHLRARVEDMAAYTDALEEFLDEDGTAQQLIDEFRDDVASLEDDLDDVASRVEAIEADVEALDDDVTDILEWRDQLGSMFTGE